MEFPQKTVNIKYAEPLVFVQGTLHKKQGQTMRQLSVMTISNYLCIIC